MFLEQNRLTCVNSLPLTDGIVTRIRKCLGRVEKSTIYFYVVCESVLPFVKSMEIDNGKNHILTKYTNSQTEGKTVNSDHLPLKMEVELQAFPYKKEKKEILNFKEIKGQIRFKEITTNTEEFTNCFTNTQQVSKESEEWLKTLKSHAKRAFKTIRIRTRTIKPSAADKLITLRNKLVKADKLQELETLNVKIAKIISEESRQKALHYHQPN